MNGLLNASVFYGCRAVYQEFTREDHDDLLLDPALVRKLTFVRLISPQLALDK